MSLDKKEKKWFENTAVVIFLLLLCFPLGLFLMWQYTKWNKNVKVAVTTAIAVIILCNIPDIKNTAQEQRKMHNYKEVKKSEEKSKKDESKKEEKKETPKPDNQKEFTLSAGNYTGGFDLPVGDYKVEWVSGAGSLMSSNKVGSGGINTLVTDSVNKEVKDLKLPRYCCLNITGDVVVKVTYTKIEEGFKGKKKFDTIELSKGKYTAGKDFESGWYDIELISGDGTVDAYDKDNKVMMAENFGDDERKIKYFTNAQLKKDVVLRISGVKVRLINKK